MRWPWSRRQNGEAKQAIADAREQHQAARDKEKKADATAKAARELTRRTDRFAREIEKAWHLRRGST